MREKNLLIYPVIFALVLTPVMVVLDAELSSA